MKKAPAEAGAGDYMYWILGSIAAVTLMFISFRVCFWLLTRGQFNHD